MTHSSKEIIERTLVHIPQNLRTVASRGSLIGLEVILVPSILMAYFAHQNHVMRGVAAVFIWRILFGFGRWLATKALPATSVLTFATLAIRTSVAIGLGVAVSEGTGMKAYLIPAAVTGIALGAYAFATAFSDKPLIMRLAKDFIEISEDKSRMLLPIFKHLTGIFGFFFFVSSLAGFFIAIFEDEKYAALATSYIGVASPAAIAVTSVIVILLLSARLRLQISFKQLKPAMA